MGTQKSGLQSATHLEKLAFHGTTTGIRSSPMG